ncbi:MAG: hypothetical protein WAV78_39645, partial [Xanthobacteraceae bacterium]
ASIDPSGTGNGNMPGPPAESHRRRPNHPPTIRSDFDRMPVIIGEIEIDAPGVRGGPDVDRALWAIELGARL